MILDSLHYWVEEMHVDGFRFDLASILSRDDNGQPLDNPPVLWDIDSDPVLAGTKLIAEAWDAGGPLPGGQLRGRPLDRVERAVPRRRAGASSGATAARSGGSPRGCWAARTSIGHQERGPEQSINFVTCHDGFTLERPGLVRPQAQRGQRRGQPRRHATTT